MFFALIILVIGLVFLLKNLGYITGEVWPIVWPSLLIALALGIIFKKKKCHKDGWEKFGDQMGKFGEKINKKFNQED